MIACDTSSLSSFLRGESGLDIEQIATAAASGQLAIPPVVITEILSSADLPLGTILDSVATMDLHDGYWERAGQNRRLLKQNGLRAKIGDALIAQSCIDHDVALITRDTDFRHFATHCGLKLA